MEIVICKNVCYVETKGDGETWKIVDIETAGDTQIVTLKSYDTDDMWETSVAMLIDYVLQGLYAYDGCVW